MIIPLLLIPDPEPLIVNICHSSDEVILMIFWLYSKTNLIMETGDRRPETGD